MIKNIVSILSVLTLSGCAHLAPEPPKIAVKPPRVIERNLVADGYISLDDEYEQMKLVKVLQENSKNLALEHSQKQLHTLKKGKQASEQEVLILKELVKGYKDKLNSFEHKEMLPVASFTFPSESDNIEDVDNLASILSQFRANYETGKKVMIVGHSHGASKIGESVLAASRAESVKKVIEMMGVSAKNIQALAYFGERRPSGSIYRGVQVYLLDNVDYVNLAMLS